MQCLVRATVDDAWADLDIDGGPRLLKCIPDLADTPKEQLTLPDDEANVVTRFDSKASIIVPTSKVRALVKHCKEIYRRWSFKFHRDSSYIVEKRGQEFPCPDLYATNDGTTDTNRH